MHDPLTPVGQRHPYAVWGAAVCALSGLGITLGGPQPNSIDATLPTAFVHIWGAILLLGGAALLISNIIRDPVLAILLERVGSLFLGGMCIVYSVAAFALAGAIATFPGSLAAGFGIASLWRVWQITARLRRFRTYLHQLSDQDDSGG